MAVTMTLLTCWAEQDPGKACQSVVLGSGMGALLTLVCLVVLRPKDIPSSGRIPVRSRLLNLAVPLALADDLKAGINTTENLMVPKRLGLFPGTTAPLAAFGMVCGMVFPILMFPAAILFSLAELLIPELARCAAARSHNRIHYLVRRSLRLAMLYGCTCGGLLFLLAEPLCATLYQSAEAGSYLRLYAILAPMLYCDAITDAMTKGLGQQKANVRYNIITSTMDVILLYFLLPKYGMTGYFLSFFLTHLLNFILSLRRLLKITKLQLPFHTPALTCAAAMAAALGASFLTSVPMRIAAYVALLGSLLTLMRVISKKDFTWLTGLVSRKGTV
jgi:stage V sporulation protein B